MRPVIKPALRVLRRDVTTVQIGLDPRRAIVLSGTAAGTVLNFLDGTRERAQVLDDARAAGLCAETAGRVLTDLAERGVLDDATTNTQPLRSVTLDERDRLQPDVASASLVSGDSAAGLPTLTRRRRAAIHVYGAGRVGATVASLLAAAGVGRVRVVDPEPARPRDAAPAGISCADAGDKREQAAASAIRHAAPATRTDAPDPPDLAVLAPVDGTDPDAPEEVLRQEIPHLPAGVRETRGSVGPLVVAGRSACLRCQHLHRTDRDPAWPRVAAQLAAARHGAEACDVVLATAVASVTANQVLTYLDTAAETLRHGAAAEPVPYETAEVLPTLNGSLELTLPHWRWRRRSWSPHPRCGCGWNIAL